MERTYRLMTRDDEPVSEVVAPSLDAAVSEAEDMGFNVVDTVYPDIVLVTADDGSGPALQVTIKTSGEGVVFSNGRVSPTQAASMLRTIADGLEASDGGGG